MTDVTSIIHALDAAIAGHEGHRRINRLLALHEAGCNGAVVDVDNLTEYWRERGQIAKSVHGTKNTRRLLQLHDNLDATRGVDHPHVVELRAVEKIEYWALRSQMAEAIRREA